MVQKTAMLCILTMAAYRDWKEKKVYVYGMLAAGTLGIVLHLLYRTPSLRDMFLGAGIGFGVLLLAVATGESIGIGDGMVLAVSGIFLGFRKNLELLLAALFLAGVVSLFLLTVKRKGRKYRLPFVPFLAAAYLLQLL